ncbi:MAG: hypothetical protein HOO01_01105 [Cellvibrionales bacterium]|nr:hypothetical protein [Cellvibrionales bacterium]
MNNPIVGCVYSKQRGLSIPTALFVLVVVAMLGAAMQKILSQGEQSIAREVLSMRALMAAESGIERSLHQVLEINPASCTGSLNNPPSSLTPLISAWSLLIAGMSSCDVNVSCGVAQHDSDGDGTLENYYTLRSSGQCGPPADRAFRLVEVQARG